MIAYEREFRYAARAARSRSAVLPVVIDGVCRTLDAYDRSALGAFHRDCYATPKRDDRDCAHLFELLPLSELPRGATAAGAKRSLMAEQMRPRDIAAVVRSRYLANFGWGSRWTSRDPSSRAEFDVRVFSGKVAAGLDRAIDFNCRSAQEK